MEGCEITFLIVGLGRGDSWFGAAEHTNHVVAI